MERYGLLGEHLSHSLSPQIHAFFGEYPYDLIEKPKDAVAEWFRHAPYRAINVTIPYKKDVLPLCDELDEAAKRIGSVNTVRFDTDAVRGYNTDYDGFSYMLNRAGMAVAGKKVLVLGSGGASATVCCVLQDLGAAKVVVVSRSGSDNYENLHRHADAQVIVNTTPVGMYPHTDAAPISLERFTQCEAVADLIYNPLRTRLLQDAASRGMKTANGLAMLVAQGRRAAEIFFKKAIPDEVVEQALAELERSFRNIVLIGMPGSGKSTQARLLAQVLGRSVMDTDVLVEQQTGKRIPDMFAEEGEAAFRRLESDVIAEVGKSAGHVIATGGGAILTAQNRAALRQNAVVVFLERDLDALATDGRPLSHNREALDALYEQRLTLYRETADLTVTVNTTPEETCRQIREAIGQ